MSKLGLSLFVLIGTSVVLTLVNSQALSPGSNGDVNGRKGGSSRNGDVAARKFKKLLDGEESTPGEDFEYSLDDDSVIESVGFKLVKTVEGIEDLVIQFFSRKLFVGLRQVACKRKHGKFLRLRDLKKFKLGKNEKIAGCRSYVENGERFISFETFDQSNADEDSSQETTETKTITTSETSITTFSSSSEKCVKSIQISFSVSIEITITYTKYVSVKVARFQVSSNTDENTDSSSGGSGGETSPATPEQVDRDSLPDLSEGQESKPNQPFKYSCSDNSVITKIRIRTIFINRRIQILFIFESVQISVTEIQIAVRRRRTHFYRVSQLHEFRLKESEEISGIQCSYASDGEQLISFEISEKSNAEVDKSVTSEEQEQEIEENQSITKEFSASSGRCVQKFSIVIIKKKVVVKVKLVKIVHVRAGLSQDVVKIVSNTDEGETLLKELADARCAEQEQAENDVVLAGRGHQLVRGIHQFG